MGSKLKMGINIQDIYPRLPRLTPAAHSRYYIDYIQSYIHTPAHSRQYIDYI